MEKKSAIRTEKRIAANILLFGTAIITAIEATEIDARKIMTSDAHIFLLLSVISAASG